VPAHRANTPILLRLLKTVMQSCVKAHWSDLLLFSYAVPEDIVRPYVHGFDLDHFLGRAFVSVVGFYFSDTEIVGVKPGRMLPKVSQFAQWNLRTYVRGIQTSGPAVVFIKEFVPSALVTGFVRQVYHENYVTAPITLAQTERDGVRQVEYALDIDGRRHTMSARTQSPLSLEVRGAGAERSMPSPDSADFFFMERYSGSPAAMPSAGDKTGQHGGPRISFQIEHPPWNTYAVSSHEASLDFGALYGDEWRFLNDREPDFVTWCDGSAVAISWPTHS
jgi:uncharacterized protein YqjF (DUF2071 family)